MAKRDSETYTMARPFSAPSLVFSDETYGA